MTKKIAYVARMWGDVKDMKVHGDMSFSFNDSKDSRSENIDKVLEDCREYCLGDGAEQGDDTYQEDNGTFAIYEVYRADLELEEEDDPLWYGDLDNDTDELVEVCVCATKEVAGWIEEAEKERYEGVKISYRSE